MRSRAVLALLLLLPAFAGCMSDPPAQAEVAAVSAPDAEEAGATTGEAPSAPKEAYRVAAADAESAQDAVAYPVPLETNAAKAPVTLDLSGEFRPSDCRPLRFGSVEPTLAPASSRERFHDLSQSLAVGDVFQYDVTLAYENREDNWGEIHAAFGLGSTVRVHEESTQGARSVVVNWTGQGYRASEDDMAWLGVFCYYGAMTQAIPYALTVSFRFAEGAVPAEAPFLLTVPEGATKMFVRGVAVDDAKGVLSHFRVFRPDDTMLCECALSTSQQVAVVDLPAPGEYVLLVDHTDNGFVSVAFDAPPAEPMRPLASEWVQTSLLVSDGAAVDTVVEVDLPRVPLLMHAFVRDSDAGAGVGKKTHLLVANGRGEPLRATWGGHLAQRTSDGQMWLGFWPGDWEFEVDHHAFAPGKHAATIQADALRGEVVLVTRHYVR